MPEMNRPWFDVTRDEEDRSIWIGIGSLVIHVWWEPRITREEMERFVETKLKGDRDGKV